MNIKSCVLDILPKEKYIFGSIGLYFCHFRRSWVILAIWQQRQNTFRELRSFSGIWGVQCINFREQGSIDPTGGGSVFKLIYHVLQMLLLCPDKYKTIGCLIHVLSSLYLHVLYLASYFCSLSGDHRTAVDVFSILLWLWRRWLAYFCMVQIKLSFLKNFGCYFEEIR